MLRVGLTGGIGSGKSTVADQFQRFGIPIIDADLSARTVLTHDLSLLKAIRARFSDQVLTKDGVLDRKALREIIFQDPSHKFWLEQLLHPVIRDDIKHQINQLPPSPYCIIAIPLLFEAKQKHDFIDRSLLVIADEHLRQQRVLVRDNCTVEIIQEIMRSQIAPAESQLRADDIIDNNQNLAHVIKQVDHLHHQVYLPLAKGIFCRTQND